ncbi:MAG: ABC transporter ATP-binding protein [Clostridiales bacterium]
MYNIIETKGLTKKFGTFTALNGVNLQIEPGHIIGLLGPNGSGKSTLLKILNGLLEPTQGEVLILGNHPGVETKKVVSYLPERTYLNDWMKVQDIITFFNDFYEDFHEDKAIAMMKDMDIDLTARLKNLSKGTKEKVQLILVMARAAQVYLLDEPIGGVDPAARDYILKTILNKYNPEASIVISTHLITDVEQIFDDIIFLKKGEVVLMSNVDDIRTKEEKSIDTLFREVFKC